MSGYLREGKMIAKGILGSLKEPKACGETYPIDFVVTWVDGNDPAWRAERKRCLGEESINGNGVGRYRDWSSFKYWFRAVETYAPWVRYVHLITWGHVPQWLRLECPKLRIVNHKDYMPSAYLPTFNSNPLELNLFRIEGLSEHFVYFNDDVLLARPVKKEEFFLNGKPRHTAVSYPYVNRDNEIPTYLFFNTYGVANKKNHIQDCIETHSEKWFSWKYHSYWRHNLDAWRNNGISSMYFTHMGVPFCKSTMKETWNKYGKECEYTSACRLREFRQITHQIFSIEDILSGNFEPSVADWDRCILIDDFAAIQEMYESRAVKMICLFDRDNLTDNEVEHIDRELVRVFERYFPEKSCFEK